MFVESNNSSISLERPHNNASEGETIEKGDSKKVRRVWLESLKAIGTVQPGEFDNRMTFISGHEHDKEIKMESKGKVCVDPMDHFNLIAFSGLSKNIIQNVKQETLDKEYVEWEEAFKKAQNGLSELELGVLLNTDRKSINFILSSFKTLKIALEEFADEGSHEFKEVKSTPLSVFYDLFRVIENSHEGSVGWLSALSSKELSHLNQVLLGFCENQMNPFEQLSSKDGKKLLARLVTLRKRGKLNTKTYLKNKKLIDQLSVLCKAFPHLLNNSEESFLDFGKNDDGSLLKNAHSTLEKSATTLEKLQTLVNENEGFLEVLEERHTLIHGSLSKDLKLCMKSIEECKLHYEELQKEQEASTIDFATLHENLANEKEKINTLKHFLHCRQASLCSLQNLQRLMRYACERIGGKTTAKCPQIQQPESIDGKIEQYIEKCTALGEERKKYQAELKNAHVAIDSKKGKISLAPSEGGAKIAEKLIDVESQICDATNELLAAKVQTVRSDSLMEALSGEIKQYMVEKGLSYLRISRKTSKGFLTHSYHITLENKEALPTFSRKLHAKNWTVHGKVIEGASKVERMLGQGGIKTIFRTGNRDLLIAKFRNSKSKGIKKAREHFDLLSKTFGESLPTVGKPVAYRGSKGKKLGILMPCMDGDLSSQCPKRGESGELLSERITKPKEQQFITYMKEMPHNEIIGHFLELASELQEMHGRDWVHGDIHETNILFSFKNHDPSQGIASVHLADFDLSAPLLATDKYILGGRYAQSVPEKLKIENSDEISMCEAIKKVDIHCFGRVLGSFNLTEIGNEKLQKQMGALVEKMTAIDPEKRPTIDEVIEELKTMRV